MHSPILINADPSFPGDDLNDPLYESDDFYDDVPICRSSAQPSRPLEASVPKIAGSKRPRDAYTCRKGKRRRIRQHKDIPSLSLSASESSSDLELDEPGSSGPTVIWRRYEDDVMTWPVLKDGEGQQVALLQDWRERFQVPPRGDDNTMQTQTELHKAVSHVENKSEHHRRGDAVCMNGTSTSQIEATKPGRKRQHSDSESNKENGVGVRGTDCITEGCAAEEMRLNRESIRSRRPWESVGA